MCGIYGYISNNSQINKDNEDQIFKSLWKQSEIRGKEACGISLQSDKGQEVRKYIDRSTKAYKDKDFKHTVSRFQNISTQKVLVGHSRLQTNGESNDNTNNQPIKIQDQVLVHNGIVCNYEDLYIDKDIAKTSELDSEYLVKRYHSLLTKLNNQDSLSELFSEIEGETTIATFNKKSLDIATNCGNLYYIYFEDSFELIFSSERRFLIEIQKLINKSKISHLSPGSSLIFDLKNKNMVTSNVSLSQPRINFSLPLLSEIKSLEKSFWKETDLQVCKLGILNSNMPGIKFDKDGVSNVSKNFKKFETQPQHILEEKLSCHRSIDGSPDILVGFSGGRDSSYMLHLLKNKYEMNPVAVTYDWGMVTDLARRNQARICGALGVEHIVVAADIPKNRKYINQYVNAWLNKPHLGMVPLFMAGDKKFFKVLNETAALNNINLIGYGSAPYEFTSFKTGFAGMNDPKDNQNLYDSENNLKNFKPVSQFNSKIKLSLFYLKQVLSNNKYWNKSLIEAVLGFKHSYFEKKDYLQLFEYEKWDEDQINKTLISEYGWETDPTIPSSWRIGDGTAPFYNFIYKSFVDFSEHDTFRNNQVLSNVMDRKTALRIVKRENEPRFEKIEEYLDLINMNYDQTIERIVSFRNLNFK
jgi:hypothetical protein